MRAIDCTNMNLELLHANLMTDMTMLKLASVVTTLTILDEMQYLRC